MKTRHTNASLISKLRQPYHKPTRSIRHKKTYKRDKRVGLNS